MTTLPSIISPSLPSIFTVRPEARTRVRDFFSSHIRNPNTRRAYLEAVRQFSAFCAENGILDLTHVEPVHVAAFVELQLKTSIQANREGPAGRAPNVVRLDGGGSDSARQSRPRGPWPEAYTTARQDTCAAG